MNLPLIIVIGTQILFTLSDLLARSNMSKLGFSLNTFFNSWFFLYFTIKMIAMTGQLYLFSVPNLGLGKTMALFGAVSIVLSNILSFLFLKEVLSVGSYIGVVLAVIAFLVLSFS